MNIADSIIKKWKKENEIPVLYNQHGNKFTIFSEHQVFDMINEAIHQYRIDSDPEYKKKSLNISNLDVSCRTYWALKNNEIENLADLSNVSVKDFQKTRNVGEKTILELTELMQKNGLNWKGK